MKTVESIQNLLPEHVVIDPKTILELIKEFSSTWMSLDAYDKDSLRPIGLTKKSIKLTRLELVKAIGSLHDELLRIGETTEIFAQERVAGSVEEKAAHLLYFMVKNHPFIFSCSIEEYKLNKIIRLVEELKK